MENKATINEIMRHIGSLSLDGKLEILFRLTKILKYNARQKKEKKLKIIDELYGSWHNMEPNIIDEVIESRTISDRELFFNS